MFKDPSDEEFNKIVSYNGMKYFLHFSHPFSASKSIEDAERKYLEIIEIERQQFKKKEFANKEIISEISKRLKVLHIFLNLQA